MSNELKIVDWVSWDQAVNESRDVGTCGGCVYESHTWSGQR